MSDNDENPEVIETEPAYEPDPVADVEEEAGGGGEPEPAPRTARGLVTDNLIPRQTPSQQNAKTPAPVQLDEETTGMIELMRQSGGDEVAAFSKHQAEEIARLKQQMNGVGRQTQSLTEQQMQARNREVHEMVMGGIDGVVASGDPKILEAFGESWETATDAQAKAREKVARIAAGIHHGDPTMSEAEAIEQATHVAARGVKPPVAANKSQAVQQVNKQVQRAGNRQVTPPGPRTGKAPAIADPKAAAVDKLREKMRTLGISK